MECLFCKIINNEIPSYKIYEDELVLAFLDINPKTSGHTLIIPKKHFLDLDDIDQNTLNRIMEVAKIIKKRIFDNLNPDGLVLVQNNGNLQEVKHYHLHLIPSYSNSRKMTLEEIHTILK